MPQPPRVHRRATTRDAHRLDPERLSDAAREAAETQAIHSLGALDWADDAWDPPADLALGDDATHAYIVELLYEHVLGPLRR